MRLLAFICLLTLGCQLCLAQDIPVDRRRIQHVIKYNPLNIVEPVLPLGLAYELRASTEWGFQTEINYLTQGATVADSTVDQLQGERIRIEIKRYGPQYHSLFEWYLSPSFMYKSYTFNRIADLGHECQDFDCQYFQTTSFKTTKTIWAYHFLVGAQAEPATRFFIDSYMGVGIRFEQVRSVGKQGGTEMTPRIGFPDRKDGNFRRPGFMLGFRFAYMLSGL